MIFTIYVYTHYHFWFILVYYFFILYEPTFTVLWYLYIVIVIIRSLRFIFLIQWYIIEFKFNPPVIWTQSTPNVQQSGTELAYLYLFYSLIILYSMHMFSTRICLVDIFNIRKYLIRLAIKTYKFELDKNKSIFNNIKPFGWIQNGEWRKISKWLHLNAFETLSHVSPNRHFKHCYDLWLLFFFILYIF